MNFRPLGNLFCVQIGLLNVRFAGSIHSGRILAKVCWRSAENWWLGEGNKQMSLLQISMS